MRAKAGVTNGIPRQLDLALEEETGVFLVSGTRDAKPRNGEVTTQQYSCRVQKTANWLEAPNDPVVQGAYKVWEERFRDV
jgi:hypothetical protein